MDTLGLIKDAAARANKKLGLLTSRKATAISRASKEVWQSKHNKEFPLDVFQTGSGTSSNMNANEVIANLAYKLNGIQIDPNDEVNMSQSSNDVIPTAIKVSAYKDLTEKLYPALEKLIKEIEKKEIAFKGLIKTGRTHLMDAMPLEISQELSAWSSQLKNVKKTLVFLEKRLLEMPLGGTAVGTGINVLMKISNDLRWMNSGPLAGLSEIELKALQPGSSIMPGKVNPVIPEAVAMASADVIGNDTTITIAAQSGNFQLNVMLPVIAYNLLKSMALLTGSMNVLADKTIRSFKVNKKALENALNRNPILVTALNPVIGYAKAAEIAKKAYRENLPIIEVALEETNLTRAQLSKYLDPKKLIKGGIK